MKANAAACEKITTTLAVATPTCNHAQKLALEDGELSRLYWVADRAIQACMKA
jgi:hypothetical protein